MSPFSNTLPDTRRIIVLARTLLVFSALVVFSGRTLATDDSVPQPFDLLTPDDTSSVENRVDPMAGPALRWEPSSDPQSGIDHYEVWMDGEKVADVPREMYTAYPQDYGEHTWRVVAVNGAGLKRKSERFTFTARTLAVCQDQKPAERFLNGPVSSSIQEAVDRAQPGDTILVYPGIYRESITIDVPDLTIKTAEYSEKTRPQETESLNAKKQKYALKIEADGVTVQGLSIENFSGSGLVIEGNDVTIQQNQILGPKIGRGILVRDSKNVSLRRNLLESLNQGVKIESGASEVSLQYNNFVARHGILIQGNVKGVLLKHNDLERNRRGIVVQENNGNIPSGVEAHYNDLRKCGRWGLQVEADSDLQKDSVIDATNNWWGDADGPAGQGPGQGSTVSRGAQFKPWLTRYFQPSWESLEQDSVPEWYKDAKFGIYMHWTPAAVPGKQSGRYASRMYRSLKEYHTKNYGHPSEFGFKDFIPMFTLENWDPDRMAKILHQSGAKFAGLSTEHHDGFAMWDSELSQWDVADMGPRRDVTGELARAVRKHDMKLVLSQHRINLTSYWPNGGWYSRKDDFDTRNPKYWGLYFPPFQGRRSDEWLQDWKKRLVEKIHKYKPALMWMENGWDEVGHPVFPAPSYYQKHKKTFVSEWYNKCLEWGIEPVLTYKQERKYKYGVLDLEGGKMKEVKPYWWQTDTQMGGGWFFNRGRSYDSVNRLVDDIIDRTSKRGITLLSFGPKADGTLPDPVKDRLKGIGNWMDINGEAIYETRPWKTFKEGEDLRFTRSKSGNVIYVISLSWPGSNLSVEKLSSGSNLLPDEIEHISMLGSDEELEWSHTDQALQVNLPEQRPCDHAYAFKVELKQN